jgi:hypothetical protein
LVNAVEYRSTGFIGIFRMYTDTLYQPYNKHTKNHYTRNGGESALVCDNCECGVIETQSHCMVCPKLEGIRQGLDLTKIDDLSTFFQQLLAERAKVRPH